MGGLEIMAQGSSSAPRDGADEKRKRKPKARKEAAEKTPVSQKENLEALLKFCGLNSSDLDKVLDTVEERLKNPWKFVPEKERRAGCRANFISELNKLLRAIDLPKSPTVNVLGIDMPVFFNRGRFKNLQKHCSVINDVLKKSINPLYKKGAVSDEIFKLPFFDIDMCLNYGWLDKGDDIIRYLEPGVLDELWDKKIKNRSKVDNIDDLQEIYANAVEFDPSNEPTHLDEFEVIISEELSNMTGQVENSDKLIDLKYGHLIETDYFIAIISKEVLGNLGFTMKARRFLLSQLLDRGGHNLTLIPSLHDRETSFGIYQTVKRTHKSLSSEFGNVSKFPPFEKCLGFREQTRTMVWLIYTNMRAIEQFTFRKGPKHVRENRSKLFQSVGKTELKRFFYKALSIMHNRGMSAYTSAILSMSDKGIIYKTFAQFESALFESMGATGYGIDVNHIISN